MELYKAVDLFLNEHKPTTRRSHAYSLRPMRDFLGPSRPVDAVRPEHVLEYAHTLLNRSLAPASIRKHYKAIKAFFNWLVRIELIARSPAAVLRSPGYETYVSRDKAMTDVELNRLLDFVKWKPRDHALILFLADTGCRAGGAAYLTTADLELDTLRAYVTEKGDKRRPVAYGPACGRALRLWLFKRPRSAGDYVFSRGARAVKPENISQIVKRDCLKAGIRPLGSHSLRHRKGHQLADAHVAPTIAATALGHSDPVVTLHHYYPADWDSAERELRKLVSRDGLDEKTIELKSRSG